MSGHSLWKGCVPSFIPSQLTRLAAASVAVLLLVLSPWATDPAAAQADEATSEEAETAPAADQSAVEEAEEAEEALHASIRVLQQRPILRGGRFELQTLWSVGLADTMFQHMALTGNARYHITERWSVGASGAYYFPDSHKGLPVELSTTSSLFDEVTDKFEVFPERAIIEWWAGVDAAFMPLEGKFAVFDQHIIWVDFYLLAGLGVLQTSRSDDIKVGGVVGAGWRIYLTKWLALTSEVRDHMYVEDYNAGSEFVNHVTFQFGLSWFFPPDFEYRFAR